MKLYSLSEEEVAGIIAEMSPRFVFLEGKHEIVGEKASSKFGYPIKVVFTYESGQLLVITAYPLRKGVGR